MSTKPIEPTADYRSPIDALMAVIYLGAVCFLVEVVVGKRGLTDLSLDLGTTLIGAMALFYFYRVVVHVRRISIPAPPRPQSPHSPPQNATDRIRLATAQLRRVKHGMHNALIIFGAVVMAGIFAFTHAFPLVRRLAEALK